MTSLTPLQINNMIKNASSLELELIWIPKFLQSYDKTEVIGFNVFDALFINKLYNQTQAGKQIDTWEAYKVRGKLLNYSVQYTSMTA